MVAGPDDAIVKVEESAVGTVVANVDRLQVHDAPSSRTQKLVIAGSAGTPKKCSVPRRLSRLRRISPVRFNYVLFT